MMNFENIAFIGNMIDRQLEKRPDDSLQKAMACHDALFVALEKGETFYRHYAGGNDLFLSRADIEILMPDFDQAVLLGRYHQKPVLAVSVQSGENLPQGLSRCGLRETYMDHILAAEQSGALAQAAALLSWHKNNSYCARCGEKSRMAGGGVKRVCDRCQTEHFPRTDPVAIMLVHYGEKCLLARTPNFAAGRYSCLAGFIEQGETFEAAVRREAQEEMGVAIGEVTYLASQPWPFPHSLMLGAHAQALSDAIMIDYDEMEDGRWFGRDEVRQMMAGTHAEGFHIPPSGAIAYSLIKQWLDM